MSRKILLVTLMTAASLAESAWGQKTATPKPSDREALAEPSVKELLLLMDSDKNGKISKQEWMKFMEFEFDRLDLKRKGELDSKELRQSVVIVKHVPYAKLGR